MATYHDWDIIAHSLGDLCIEALSFYTESQAPRFTPPLPFLYLVSIHTYCL